MNVTSPSALRHAGILLTLAQSNVFSGLSPAIISAVADISDIMALRKGEILRGEGNILDAFYIVQSGQLALTTPESGKAAQIIQVFGPKASYGLISMVSRTSLGTRCVALKPTHVIIIPREAFFKLYQQTPELVMRLYTAVVDYARKVVEGLGTIKGLTLESRLALWIVNESSGQEMADPDAHSYKIALKINKKTLAAKLGVTSGTLSRMFAYFRDEGIFKSNKHEIEVLDRQSLQDFAFGRRAYTTRLDEDA